MFAEDVCEYEDVLLTHHQTTEQDRCPNVALSVAEQCVDSSRSEQQASRETIVQGSNLERGFGIIQSLEQERLESKECIISDT